MRIPRLVTAALLLPAVLAGCSDGGPSDSSAITQALAADMAEVLLEDQDAMLDASTVDPATGVAVTPAPGPAYAGPPPCTPLVSPSPPGNADGDAVPDSARFDFSGCAFARGNFAFVLSGIIHIIDPAAAPAGFGLKAVFEGFRRERTHVPTSRTVASVFDGARQVTGNADALTHLIVGFRTAVTRPGLGTVLHEKDWNGSFTADVPGSIAPGQPLPSGVLNVAGSSEWSRGQAEFYTLSVTTSGLHFDAGCTIAPRFDAGFSSLVITRRGVPHTVLVEHTACGQFTVTRS